MSEWRRETTWRRNVPPRTGQPGAGWAAGWVNITRADGDDTYRWEVVLVDVEGVAASGSTSVNFTAAKAQAMAGYREACDKLEKARGG